MPQFNSESIARVKSLLLFPILKQPDPSISQHTITVHQKQLDAGGLFLD
jgi:hypothetical protein